MGETHILSKVWSWSISNGARLQVIEVDRSTAYRIVMGFAKPDRSAISCLSKRTLENVIPNPRWTLMAGIIRPRSHPSIPGFPVGES